MEWYYAKHGQQEGPLDDTTLRAKLRSGEIAPTDLVWREGMAVWAAAEKVAELGAAPGSGGPGLAPAPGPGGGASPGGPGPVMGAGLPPHQGPGGVLMMAPVPPTSGLAIASMTCGIVGVLLTMGCLLGGITGVPAVICGHGALRSIRSSPVPIGGRGMAIAGLVTGYLACLGTLVLGMMFMFAIFSGGMAGMP